MELKLILSRVTQSLDTKELTIVKLQLMIKCNENSLLIRTNTSWVEHLANWFTFID